MNTGVLHPLPGDTPAGSATWADRYHRDGCLLLRGAVPPEALTAVTEQAASALRRSGLAEGQDTTVTSRTRASRAAG